MFLSFLGMLHSGGTRNDGTASRSVIALTVSGNVFHVNATAGSDDVAQGVSCILLNGGDESSDSTPVHARAAYGNVNIASNNFVARTFKNIQAVGAEHHRRVRG